jgi:hypothetical protein
MKSPVELRSIKRATRNNAEQWLVSPNSFAKVAIPEIPITGLGESKMSHSSATDSIKGH